MNVINHNYQSTFGTRVKFQLDFDNYGYMLKKKYSFDDLQYNKSLPIAIELNDHYLAIATESGFVSVLDTEVMLPLHRFQAHNNVVFDLKWRPFNYKQLLTASGDQSIVIWDLNEEKELLTLNSGHNSSIKTVCFYNADVFASGGRDGFVRLWDLRMEPKLIQSIKDAHKNNLFCKKQRKYTIERSNPNSVVTSLIFGTDNYLYTTGANDGCIKIWDIRKLGRTKIDNLIYVNKLEYCGSNEKAEGFTSVALDSSQRLYASCSDNKIYCYDYKLGLGCKTESDYIKCFKGAVVTNYTKIKVLNDDLLISGSKETEACIWSLDKAEYNVVNYPISTLPHGIEEVSGVSCDPHNYNIYTCDDDIVVSKWTVHAKNQVLGLPLTGYSKEYTKILGEEFVCLSNRKKAISPKTLPLTSLNNWFTKQNTLSSMNSIAKKRRSDPIAGATTLSQEPDVNTKEDSTYDSSIKRRASTSDLNTTPKKAKTSNNENAKKVHQKRVQRKKIYLQKQFQ